MRLNFFQNTYIFVTASLLLIGSMFGAVIGGLQCQWLGRKKSLLIDCIFLSASYLGVGFSPNLTILLICRFICGHCVASLLVNIPAYTSEICQPEVRKLTGSFVVVAFTGGFSLMLVIGALFNWRNTMQIMAVFPIISFALVFWFVPDSPIWLLMKQKDAEAWKSMMILRGNESVVNAEMKRIRTHLEQIIQLEKEMCEVEKPRWFDGILEIYDIFTDVSFLKPFMVLVIIFCIGLEWTGLPAIAFYMVTLLKEAEIPIDPYWAAAALAGYRSLLLMFSSAITKYFKRRPMYLINSLLMALGNAGIGTYFLLNAKQGLIQSIPLAKWIPVASIIIVYTAFSLGFGSVPYMLQGEILPAQSRAIGTGFLGFLDNLSCFLAAKLAPSISEYIGNSGSFYLYAGCIKTA